MARYKISSVDPEEVKQFICNNSEHGKWIVYNRNTRKLESMKPELIEVEYDHYHRVLEIKEGAELSPKFKYRAYMVVNPDGSSTELYYHEQSKLYTRDGITTIRGIDETSGINDDQVLASFGNNFSVRFNGYKSLPFQIK